MKYFLMSDFESEIEQSSEVYDCVLEYIDKNSKFIKRFVSDGLVYYIDTKTFGKKCCFDMCLKCVQIHGCDCCYGVPYIVEDDIIENISSIFNGISEYFDDSKLDFIKKFGWINFVGDAQEGYNNFDDSDIPKTFRNDGKSCIFHMYENGVSCCAIHKYCLENKLMVYEYKPSQCLMFPLDFIELDDGSIFCFVFDESTVDFSRWGEDYLDFICVNKDSNFVVPSHLVNYRPVYVEQCNFIRKMFSNDVYKNIKNIMKRGGV